MDFGANCDRVVVSVGFEREKKEPKQERKERKRKREEKTGEKKKAANPKKIVLIMDYCEVVADIAKTNAIAQQNRLTKTIFYQTKFRSHSTAI